MQITLQGYVNALEQAESRRAELDTQIRELLPSWSLGVNLLPLFLTRRECPLQEELQTIQGPVRQHGGGHAPYTKGNFQFERTVTGWRTRFPLLDLRLKR